MSIMGRRLSGWRFDRLVEAARQHALTTAHLWEQGRHRDGLVWQLNEVTACRILAEAKPAMLEAVASKLVNRGRWLFELKYYEEALNPFEEAAAICRRPEAVALPDVLLDALNNQWRTLVMLGRYEQALAACQEAVAVCVGDEQFGLGPNVRMSLRVRWARAVVDPRGPSQGWEALRRNQSIACLELEDRLRTQGHTAWAETAFRGSEQCRIGKAEIELGDFLGACGDLSAAEAAYERAALCPKPPRRRRPRYASCALGCVTSRPVFGGEDVLPLGFGEDVLDHEQGQCAFAGTCHRSHCRRLLARGLRPEGREPRHDQAPRLLSRHTRSGRRGPAAPRNPIKRSRLHNGHYRA